MHSVRLESTHGATIAHARAVPSAELVQCFKKFAQAAESIACPVIFVDGIGYTQTRDFLTMVHAVNEFSTRHNGTQIF